MRKSKLNKLKSTALTSTAIIACLVTSLVNAEANLMNREPPFTLPSIPDPAPILLPVPLAWSRVEERKKKLLAGEVPTAISDAGCTTNCNMEFISECGYYGMGLPPYRKTGEMSSKICSHANRGLTSATDVHKLPFVVREPASKLHSVTGIQHNLLSTARFIDAGYAWLFNSEEIQIFDKENTGIITSRAPVMKRWRVPGEDVWRVPIVRENDQKHLTNQTPHC